MLLLLAFGVEFWGDLTGAFPRGKGVRYNGEMCLQSRSRESGEALALAPHFLLPTFIRLG